MTALVRQLREALKANLDLLERVESRLQEDGALVLMQAEIMDTRAAIAAADAFLPPPGWRDVEDRPESDQPIEILMRNNSQLSGCRNAAIWVGIQNGVRVVLSPSQIRGWKPREDAK